METSLDVQIPFPYSPSSKETYFFWLPLDAYSAHPSSWSHYCSEVTIYSQLSWQQDNKLRHHLSATTYEAGWRTDELVGGLCLYRDMLVSRWKRQTEQEQMVITLAFLIKYLNLVHFVRITQRFCKYAWYFLPAKEGNHLHKLAYLFYLNFKEAQQCLPVFAAPFS